MNSYHAPVSFLKIALKRQFYLTLLSRRKLEVSTHSILLWLGITFPTRQAAASSNISRIVIKELHPTIHSHQRIRTSQSPKMAQLRQEDLRALEQTRQRLYQLSQSIGSLKADVMRTSPMPPWYVLNLLLN